MCKDGIRAELEYKRDTALAARDALGDQIFDEGRNASKSELNTMGQLSDKADGYQELIDRFFRTPIPVEQPVWVKELLY